MHSKNQKRHGSPVPSRSPLVPMKPKTPAVAPAVNPSLGDTLAFRVPKDYPHSRFNKAPLAVYPPKGARSKTCVSLPVVSLEKMPCLSRSNSHVRLNSSAPSLHKSSSSAPTSSQRSSEKLLNGRGSGGPTTPHSSTSPSSLDGRPSPARSPLDRRPASTPSPSSQPDRKPSASQRCSTQSSSSSSTPDKKQQNGTKTSGVRSHRRVSGRVFDPNKHCGVPDPETKRPCTRSLTCKSHSLTQRRAVPGRGKHFDILLAEHKGSVKEKEGAKERQKERDVAHERKELTLNQSVPPHEASPSKPHCPNGRPLSTLKLRLANAHIPRVPGSGSSSSTPLPPEPSPPSASNPETVTSGGTSLAGDGGRLSSDEGDAETPEDTDRAAIHFTSQHPQPLGMCIFSSRLMGRGHYVFDRRWDHMRLALQSMVEKHLNSQMWRKVPLAAESLQSPSGSSFVSSQQPHPPSPLSGSSAVSMPPTNCYTATFPQTTGVFNIRDAPLSHTLTCKPGNGTHKSSRPSKVPEDSSVSSKRRKNSFCSFSSFPAIDNHKRNGNSPYPALQGRGGSVATPVRRKELGGGGSGLWSSAESWMSRADGPHNSLHSRDPGVSAPYTSNKDAATAPYHPLPSPCVPSSLGGKADGRKRRSPSAYRGKANKVSRPGEQQSLLGKGKDSSGILASGPDSPRQAKIHS